MPLPASRTEPILAWLFRVLPRERLSRLVGRLADARAPRWLLAAVLRAYVRHYQVDLAEAVVPAGGFATFNQFFTRALAPGRRPIDRAPTIVVSPADGRIEDLGPLDLGSRFVVKGAPYDAATLLDDAGAAAPFAGGTYAVVYLSPRDYHRVHAPAGGVLTAVRHIPGTLFPVNPLGVRTVPGLFARNERVAIHLECDGVGPIAVVMVGAMIVGRVSLRLPAPPRPAIGGTPAERRFAIDGERPRIERGDELGAFELGSTVVLLLPPGTEPTAQSGQTVRVGQALARLRPAP